MKKTIIGNNKYVFEEGITKIYCYKDRFQGLTRVWIYKIEIHGSVEAGYLAHLIRKVKKELGGRI